MTLGFAGVFSVSQPIGLVGILYRVGLVFLGLLRGVWGFGAFLVSCRGSVFLMCLLFVRDAFVGYFLLFFVFFFSLGLLSLRFYLSSGFGVWVIRL